MRGFFLTLSIMFLALMSQPSKADIKADQYWTDIEKLCMSYSGATHPPCNRSNGASVILDHIEQNCVNNNECLKKAVQICLKYSAATHPACNASNGLKTTLEVIQSYENDQPKDSKAKIKAPKNAIDIKKGESANEKPQYADQYWTDIEKLCMKYSGATHPPCNRSNGAKMILDEVQRNCEGNTVCLKKAVDICLKYSGATHPACNTSNGLKMTLEVIASYEANQPKEAGVKIKTPANAIDIKKGEGSGAQ